MGRERAVDSALLVLRIVLGLLMMFHGSQKLFGAFGGGGWDATIAGMQDGSGIPMIFAALAIIAEFFGGLGVLLGALTRVAAFGIAVTMAVAIILAHIGDLTSALAGEGSIAPFSYPLTLFTMAVVLIILGAGQFSIDDVIRRRKG